jgi:hypothetical protein
MGGGGEKLPGQYVGLPQAPRRTKCRDGTRSFFNLTRLSANNTLYIDTWDGGVV